MDVLAVFSSSSLFFSLHRSHPHFRSRSLNVFPNSPFLSFFSIFLFFKPVGRCSVFVFLPYLCFCSVPSFSSFSFVPSIPISSFVSPQFFFFSWPVSLKERKKERRGVVSLVFVCTPSRLLHHLFVNHLINRKKQLLNELNKVFCEI